MKINFNNLFDKELLSGISITVGRTPRGVYADELPTVSTHLIFKESNGNNAIDCSVHDIAYDMMKDLFNINKFSKYDEYSIEQKQQNDLADIFEKLGYDIDFTEAVGEWTFYKMNCNIKNAQEKYDNLKKELNNIELTC